MKVKELIEGLKKVDPDLDVWKAKDSEGNGFMQVDDIADDLFLYIDPDRSWHSEECMDNEELREEIENQTDLEDWKNVVILW